VKLPPRRSYPLPVYGEGQQAPDLYVVAERSIFESDDAWLEAIASVCRVDDPGLALQVRTKSEAPDRAHDLAVRARDATSGSRIPIFLNGTTEEAIALGYDNVHWPEALIPTISPSPSTGRGPGGGVRSAASVHSSEAALRAQHAGAHFLVAGTIFDAGSKDAPGAGLHHLRAIVSATPLPVLAIGGVTPERVASCIEAGASGVAVVTAVLRAPDIAAAIRDLREALDAARATAEVSP
jgi:thiamine-phosphate pyrophosphorylase